jgi:small subunit ribosomal protein S6
MENYETMFLISSELSKEKTQELLNQINEILTKNKAEIIAAHIWAEKKKIPFAIKKQREATYYLVKFKAATGQIAKINQDCKLNENILRFMISRLEKEK